MNTSRRAVLGAALGGAVAAGLPSPRPRRAPPPGSCAGRPPRAATSSRPSRRSRTTGRTPTRPAQPHIFAEGDNFRFNMHTVDRDTSTDRQRHEVTGCRNGSSYLQWKSGQTWRVTYSMYIPSTLKATTSFTHIMQMKQPGTGSSPIVVQSLRRVNGVQTIELKVIAGDVLVGRTNLEPLHNKWTDVDFQIKIGNGTSGSVRWILKSGGTTVIDKSKSGVDTFLADRVRPKWGIYRSLGDSSGSLQNCHMLLTNMRGYQLV